MKNHLLTLEEKVTKQFLQFIDKSKTTVAYEEEEENHFYLDYVVDNKLAFSILSVESSLYLTSIGVGNEYKRQGVTTQCMRTVIDFAQQNGYKEVVVTRITNEHFHYILDKLGFQHNRGVVDRRLTL